MKNFHDIETRNQLADYLHIPRSTLTYILYIKNVNSYYTSFEIPKRNGETRQIRAPRGSLKSIQEKLASALWEYKTEIEKQGIYHLISHGFERKKSIITNAKPHRNKRFVLNLDLENFFDSFHFGRVRGFFEKNRVLPLPHEVATVIAQLTCFEGSLPQGAPTSPIITNLICRIMDKRLIKIVQKYKLYYTRYADDLTFSTNDKLFLENKNEFLLELESEIISAGFKINNKKTRLQCKDSRQTVTGLVVNKKLNVSHAYYKTTRAMAHSFYSRGEFTIDGESGTMAQLEGRFSFITQIDKYNLGLDKRKINFRELNGREKEYQKFLFYKYFLGIHAPLIVTEGKTDIIYMRSALKNLYEKYPRLITRNTESDFIFRIAFLKKTTNIENFLGIQQNGADTMQTIYKYFTGKEETKKKSIYEYFNEVGAFKPRMPVFLLFDNELQTKTKPLYKFMNSVFKKDNIGQNKKKLRNDCYLKLPEARKLYLLTIPLTGDRKESEIEHLFSKEVLEMEIKGKKFGLCKQGEEGEYYDKKDFARYVSSNYQNIDFKNFEPVLSAIDAVMANPEDNDSYT